MPYQIHPLTAERWDDLVALFGERGGTEGCWCMFWRLPGGKFRQNAGDGNRAALSALACRNQAPGLLAYHDGQPVGWCSLAPRQEFTRLQRSRTLGPVDDQPVWSIVCFFINRFHRSQGVATALLQAAVRYAGEHGARIVEAYPLTAERDRIDNADAYTGPARMFERAGFVVAARRGSRAIMRLALDE